MPTIAVIDGIRIMMFLNNHDPPYFHVRADAFKAQFDIATGRMIKGRLDRRSLLKVQEWTELNRDLLMQTWHKLRQR